VVKRPQSNAVIYWTTQDILRASGVNRGTALKQMEKLGHLPSALALKDGSAIFAEPVAREIVDQLAGSYKEDLDTRLARLPRK